MAAYGIPDNPGRVTSSRLKKWWLQDVLGYKVISVRHRARRDCLGRMSLKETYLLAPNERTRHAH